ncbi:DDE_3 domain-containing protein [Trichonephila clavipes]|nr:DDE_3 domain-containing protein [Trichonephila clavipes]
MDGNARPHRANIVDEYLRSEDITRMDWSVYSPDLNPTEHVWDMLGQRIAACRPPPTCLLELRRALLDECSGLRSVFHGTLELDETYPGAPRITIKLEKELTNVYAKWIHFHSEVCSIPRRV